MGQSDLRGFESWCSWQGLFSWKVRKIEVLQRNPVGELKKKAHVAKVVGHSVWYENYAKRKKCSVWLKS